MPQPPAAKHAAESSEESPPAVLARRMGFLLKHAQLRYQAIQQPALAPFDLDGRRLAVLVLLDAEGPSLQARLSERLGVDRTTMVALIDSLEAIGLVNRRRDPVDRRGHRVGMTAAGAEVLGRALDAVDAVERDFLLPLSREERAQFQSLLARLVLDPLD
jgi:DNA-binding MarR family transcriptional regulator